MNKLFLPILMAASGASVALAQNADEGDRSTLRPDLAGLIGEWRGEHGASWQVHESLQTGFAEMIYGGGAQPPFQPYLDQDHEWLAVARYFLGETVDMHGVDAGTLVDDRVRFLPLGQGNTTDKMTVKLRQEIGGVAVRGGFVNVLMSTAGTLLSIQTTAEPGLDAADTVPALTAEFATKTAVEQFERLYGATTAIDDAELELVRVNLDGTRSTRLAWRIGVHRQVDGADPEGWKYAVDALTGAVLEVENMIHYFDVFGTLETMATPGTLPDQGGNPPTNMPMPHARITSSAGTVFTDINGDFNYPGVNTALNLTVEYVGTFNNVVNDTGGEHSLVLVAQPNQAQTLTLNPAPAETITSQANAYLHINTVRDWIKSVFPGDTTADFQAVSNVNLASTCNAFFNGSSTNYFASGGGCVNTAYSTVVAHEFGHWLNVLYGTGNGSDGIGEGNADVFSMYCFDTAIVGQNFFGAGSIRNGNNTRQYCGDGCGGCYGQVHADGEVWMGAAWKVRANLGNDITADTIFLGWMNSYNQTTIDSIIEQQWLTLDDDNADLSDGTPNYQAIDDGFTTQGFPGYDPAFLTISNLTQVADTPIENGPYSVSATIVANHNPPVASATLHYRDGNGGAFTPVAMSNTGGNNWEGDVPDLTSPAMIDYYVSAEDSSSFVNTLPADAPDGFDEFDIGVRVDIVVEDFEGAANGWTVGGVGDDATTGVWVQVNPRGTAAQPEDDHTDTGNTCWVTGQGSVGGTVGENDVDGGKTTLLSPIFDATGLTAPRVSYWRWYSNNEGSAPNSDVMDVDISNDGGSTWTNVENIGPSGPESNGGCWYFRRFGINAQITPTATMRVRFVASDEGDGSIVEAGVDDFLVTDLGPSECSSPSNYCIGALNSTGFGSAITTTGSTFIASNNFGLRADDVPAQKSGIFYYGPLQIQVAFGEGFRCVGGATTRLPIIMSDAGGIATFGVDFNDEPAITADSTWNFQYWYRDPAGGPSGYNLSDGTNVTFCE